MMGLLLLLVGENKPAEDNIVPINRKTVTVQLEEELEVVDSDVAFNEAQKKADKERERRAQRAVKKVSALSFSEQLTNWRQVQKV